MREQLILPSSLPAAQQQLTFWKILAVGGWALALLLGQVLLLRPPGPPPPGPGGRGHFPAPMASAQPSRSQLDPGVGRIRGLLQQQQPKRALAEISQAWSLYHSQGQLPPAELSDLFAQAVADLAPPPVQVGNPPTAAPEAVAVASEPRPAPANPRPVPGQPQVPGHPLVPGPSYPQARPRRPLSQTPPPPVGEAWAPPEPEAAWNGPPRPEPPDAWGPPLPPYPR